MKKIYVIQMHTKTIPSRFVSFFTMYKYSHVALSFTKDCEVTYSFGRKNLYSFLNGGFVIQYKDGEFFNKFCDTKCRVYEVEITDEQYVSLYNMIEDMKSRQDEYKYDFVGIILRYLKLPVTFENRYVCSYFVAEMLEKSNICEFDKKTCFVKPKDFEKMVGFNEIYTGKYTLYR
ncbi:MAG: hypothetical protein IJE89_02170 [Bacilli bacterium]|nr:hypothetical protein [Bacilli bacterium]